MRIIVALLLTLASALAQTQTVDLIWSARYVVTEDGNARVLENGALAIRGTQIVDVGLRADIARRYRATRTLHQANAILAPGLINTHTHAAMSLFRGVANDLALDDWLNRFIFPAEARNVDREFVRWGTRLALLEMALSGTTTFADMYYFEDTVAEETKAAGMRGVLGQTVIGFPAPDFKTSDEQLRAAAAFLDRYSTDALITPAIAPHAIYTTPDETLKAARALADRHKMPLLIHLAETEKEFDDARAQRGKTPVETLDALGVLTGWTVAAHAVWLTEADIATLARRGTGIAHNPGSNMMLSSGIAPIGKLLAAGVNVGLGTDGPAGSNNDFDLLEEADLAAKLQKLSSPTALTAQQAFAMATIGGARALGMDQSIGSLAAGKLADVISIRIDGPRAVPMYDPYAQLVYALKGSDVGDVMVNGRWVVRNRVPLRLNATAILAKAREYQARIAKSLSTK
jgi:5-methylthioadenosine/S-adenosylhomocysteine deaminase